MDTMQDDCYLISADGWKAETYRIIETTKKGKTKDKGWTCDLIPKPYIVARYFAKEQAEIDKFAQDLESAGAALAEFEEENGGDEGYLSDLEKITKGKVKERLQEIKGDKDADEERAVLKKWQKLSEAESDLKSRLREAEAELDDNAYKTYPRLTQAEIKDIVVEDKWLARIDGDIHGEMDRISHALAQRVRELAERYETPMPKIVSSVSDLEMKVNDNLRRMGFMW